MHRFLLACLSVLWGTLAVATTIQEKSFAELVREADGIVIGSVTTTTAKYGPDGDIYTFVGLDDLELLKGGFTGSALTLRLQGGEIGGDMLELVGAPTFEAGTRVVVFLRGNGRHIVPIVGWTQGVFRVDPGADSTGSVLDHDGNRVFGIRGGALVKEQRYAPAARFAAGPRATRQSTAPATGTGERAAPPRTPMGLAEFRKAIAGELLRAGAARAGTSLASVDGFEGVDGGQSLPPRHNSLGALEAMPFGTPMSGDGRLARPVPRPAR